MGKTRLCGANTTKRGGTCTQAAGRGTDHIGWGNCHLHGGATPHGRAYAVQQELAASVAALGHPVPTSIPEAMDLAIGLARARLEFISRRIEELTEDDVAGLVTTTVERQAGEDGGYREVRHGPPAVHLWIVEQGKAIDQLARVAKAAADIDIGERQTRVLEQNADAIAGVFARVFDEIGLSSEQRKLGAASVERHLLAIDGTATEMAA